MPLRILILGVNGFIGSSLTHAILQQKDWRVFGMDVASHKLDYCLGHERFKFIEGDIMINREWIEYHVKKCDVVLPLVAIANPIQYCHEPLRVFELDFEANLEVVRQCAKYRKRIVFPSTIGTTGWSEFVTRERNESCLRSSCPAVHAHIHSQMIRSADCRPLAVGSSLLGLLLFGCVAPENKHTQRSAVEADLQQRGLTVLRADGAHATTQVPPGISLDDGLSESEAVAIALWNNAVFQENLSKLGLARGDLAQAGMLANPTLSMLFPFGPKQLEFTATVPFEVLWLRPKRIAIAEIEAERVAQGLVQSGLDLARDVRVAFSDGLLARDREGVAAETMTIREQIFRIAENRQRLGDASELETTAARAELARARDEAGRAQREHAIARERLSLLLGWPVPGATVLSSAPPADLAAVPPVTALEAKALSARPDLRASELALEAAGRKAGLAEKEVFTLSGLIDANAQGKEGFEIGPGVALSLPILNQNEPNRLRAKAEVERAGWNYLGTRQRIVAEVRDARAKLEHAAATLVAYERQVLPPFEEVERTSRRAYELGDISPLVVQENSRQLLVLQIRRTELRAEVRRAWAELERSVGTGL